MKPLSLITQSSSQRITPRNVKRRSYTLSKHLRDSSRNGPRKVSNFRKVYLSSLRKAQRETVIGKPTPGHLCSFGKTCRYPYHILATSLHQVCAQILSSSRLVLDLEIVIFSAKLYCPSKKKVVISI